jgi:dTDP-glucose 4,6-dehydratase
VSKVLVTGSEGFIGSHLVEQLVRSGYQVKAMVQYNSFNSRGWLDDLNAEILESLEVVFADIRDPHLTKNAMAGCEYVFNLAALVAIPYSYLAPSSYIDTNIRGTLNILQAALETGVKKVIQTSTSEVYGSAKFVPITEDHPLSAQSPYAASKIAADQLALSYHASFELPVVIVRPFNTFGPRQSTRAVIPTIITQIAQDHEELSIGNVSPTRDFSFVTDTTSGFVAALESTVGLGEVFNLGSNFEISVGETVEIISEIIGKKVILNTEKERIRPEKSEVVRLWADNTKAKEQFAWKPEYEGREGFKEALSKTIDWYLDPINLAKFKSTSFTL